MKGFRCLSKRYQRNNWRNSSTTIMKRSDRILAAAARRMHHGNRCHNRKRAVWLLLSIWHYWNWPQRPESEKTQGAISPSRVKPNGAAENGLSRELRDNRFQVSRRWVCGNHLPKSRIERPSQTLPRNV